VAAYDLWAWPLGLLYWAARLRHVGYGVHLLDCTDRAHPALGKDTVPSRHYHTGKYHTEILEQQPHPVKHARRFLKRYGLPASAFQTELETFEQKNGAPPDAILVSSRMTYWYSGVCEAIDLCKKQWPQVPVALGGIYATLCHNHARAHSGADVVLQGAARESLPAWLTAVISNAPEVPVSSPDEPPFWPAVDLCHAHGALPLLTSTGCPFQCSYCASHLVSGEYNRRSPETVYAEFIQRQSTYQTTDFVFYDDALLVDSEHFLEPFLDRVIEANLPVRFHTPNGMHYSLITEPLAQKMKRAGFTTLRLSLETLDANQLQTWQRAGETCLFHRAMESLRAAGFTRKQLGIYIMAGIPGQTVDAVQMAIDEVHVAGGQPFLNEYSPIPGTLEWQRALALSGYEIEEEPLWQNNSLYYTREEVFPLSVFEELKQRAHTAPLALSCK
jgi:radical SAM superfamily enzyme YgiQ (UPF0313 family)